MDEISQNPSITHIRKMSWQPPVIIGSAIAISVIFEQLIIDLLPQLWLQWAIRIALIVVICLVSWWLAISWVKGVESRWDKIDQRLLAMQSLVNITVEIVSELDKDKVLQNIAINAADLVSAPFGCLFLFDEQQDGMRLVAQTPYHINLVARVYKRGEGVAGMALETGKPLIVNGYTTWEKRIPDNLLPLDAFVGIPLLWKGNVIGALAIGDEVKHRPFYEADILMLQPFADMASIAINNSLMYSNLQQLTMELEQSREEKAAQLVLTREELVQKTVQLQRLFKQLMKIQESERARISHDMHDSTTQLILAAVYGTQAVMDGMLTNPEQSRVNLQTVQMLLHQIEIEIRETIRNLRPIILDQEGVLVAIKQYVDRVAALSNLKCEFNVIGTPIPISKEVEVDIYRIVQESLQNTTTHAHAQKITVHAQFLTDTAVFTVEDDGIGFSYSEETLQDANHFGLAGMRERAATIGASIQIVSEPGRGTCVTLSVPCSHEIS